MDFRLLSSSPRQGVWRWLVAGDAVKTECDERVAQRGESRAALAPVQKHQRERGMFLRLHHEIPGVRIGVENGFGKSGKQRIEDKASKNKPAAARRDSLVKWSLEKPNALDTLHKDFPIRDAEGRRDAVERSPSMISL